MAVRGTSSGASYIASPEYRQSVEDQRAHHERSKTFSGSLLQSHVCELRGLVRDLGVKTILDYGCGKAVAWTTPFKAMGEYRTMQEHLGVPIANVDLWDPAVPGKDWELREGATYDLVILSHVLFWIPLADLQAWVLPKVYRHARLAVVVIETIGEEKKRFLSNREAHPRGFHALDWIDLLLPVHLEARRPETRLCTEYRAKADGRIRAGWWKL